jgi:hypothetical protein
MKIIVYVKEPRGSNSCFEINISTIVGQSSDDIQTILSRIGSFGFTHKPYGGKVTHFYPSSSVIKVVVEE